MDLRAAPGASAELLGDLRLLFQRRSTRRARYAPGQATLIWEEGMPTFVGFNTFAALPEEQISEKISRRILAGDQGMVVWWSIGSGVHVEPHSRGCSRARWSFALAANSEFAVRATSWSFREVQSTRHGFAKTPR